MTTNPAEARRILEEARRIAPYQASEHAFIRFREAAAMYRALKLYFESGIAESAAISAAWGKPPKMREAYLAAIHDWTRLVDASPASSPASLAASQKINRQSLYARDLLGEDQVAIESNNAAIDLARARQMEEHFTGHSDRNAYLMSGVQLSADLLGDWAIVYPPFEVPDNVEYPGTPYTVHLAPAFSLYVSGWMRVDWPVRTRRA